MVVPRSARYSFVKRLTEVCSTKCQPLPPGPVCYKKGGPLTVTDANLVLGRLLPDFFPRIFGPNEDEPLDRAAAYTQMQNLTNDVGYLRWMLRCL